jgi:CubicO group peptidase (beta-lactamase class C family)
MGMLVPLLVTATGDVRSHGELGVHTTWAFEAYPEDGLVAPRRPGIVANKLSALQEQLRPLDLSPPLGCSSLDAVWYSRLGADGKREPNPVARYLAIARHEYKTPYDLFEAPADPQRRIEDNQFGVMEAPIMKKARGSYMRLHAAVPAPKNKNGARATVMHMKRDTYEAWPKELEQDFACGTITDGLLRSSELALCRDVRKLQNFVPLEVRANGVGGDIRFCVTWAKKLKPKTRYFRLWSGAEDAPPQIKVTLQQPSSPRSFNALPFPEYSEATNNSLVVLRDKLQERMREKNISNAQLAIAVNGRLKLVWSLTYGEAGWTMTQPRHKFRFASCAKILTALRAVTLGEDFLNQSLAMALGLAIPADLSADEFESWSNFYGIRVEDCLRNTSGLTNTYWPIFNAAFEDGRAQLPLAAGDFTLAFQNGAVPKLQVFPSRQTEGYCNVGFIAVGEAIGLTDKQSPRRYFDAMNDFWPLDKDLELVRIVPGTKADSFTFGEVPVRAPIAVQRDTYVAESVITAAGQPAPEYVSGGYGQSDASALGPTGGLSMSAATLVRLLQMMHPQGSPSPLQGTRLTLAQLLRMHLKQSGTVDRVSDQDAVTSSDRSPLWGLGFRTRFKEGVEATRDSPERPHEAEASWGGDFDTGQSGFSHTSYLSPSFGPTQSMSIAFVTNCEQKLQDFNEENGTWSGAIRSQARFIFNNGGWDNEVDLFSVLNLE